MPRSHATLAAGAFALLTASAVATPAAALVADGAGCTLSEAILSANAGSFDLGNGCGPGEAGADVIELAAAVVLTTAYAALPPVRGGGAGLPDVISEITVVAAGGTTIERDAALGCAVADPAAFRLLNVTGGGDLTLDGVTLRNGCIAPPAGEDGYGGAVLVDGSASSLTLRNASFAGNRVRGGVGTGTLGLSGHGGAVAAVGGATLVVESTLFTDNEVRGGRSDLQGGHGYGGAVHLGLATATIRTSRFEGNAAVGGRCSTACTGGFAFAGAVRASGGDLEVTDSVFTANTATGGFSNGGAAGTGFGGALATDSTAGLLQRLIVQANRAEGGTTTATTGGGGYGGGLYLQGLVAPALVDSLIGDNLARGLGAAGALGGGAFVGASVVEVRGSAFVDNAADGAPGNPPVAAYGGGLVASGLSSTITVVDTTFHHNWASAGDHTGSGNGANALGGALHLVAQVTLSHVTMVGNQVLGGSGPGGGGAALGAGLWAGSIPIAVDDSLLVDNLATDGAGTVTDQDCWDSTASVDSGGYNVVEAPVACDFTAAGDQTGPTVAAGLLPLADNGCLAVLPDGTCPPTIALTAGSAALDAGSCAVSGRSTDQRGTPRPQDHPDVEPDAADACDVGAFELSVATGGFYTVTPCRALDTRLAPPALAQGALRSVPLGVCGVPGTAIAAAVNVTVTEPTAGGHVTLFPGGGVVPPTSTLNFGRQQTRANNAIVPLATDGSGSVDARAVLAGATDSVHLIVDVVGYFD